MEYSNHTRIPVRLRVQTCFWGPDHHIRVCSWLYGVTVASNIVCCVIYLQSLATEDFVASNKDGIPIFVRELAISVTFTFLIEEAS